MSIEWQEELATGITAIDEQHREIFARFSAFSSACNNGDAKEELTRLAQFLEDYTIGHFRNEEKAMLDADYPELSAQQKAHGFFTDGIAKLKAKLCEHEPDITEILEMKRFLIRWLIQHIKHLDMALAAFLKGQGASH